MGKAKTLGIARLVLIAIAMFTAGSAIADKPMRGDGGKQEKHQQKGQNKQKAQHQQKEKHKQKEQRQYRDDRQGGYGERSYHDRDRLKYSGGWYFGDQHRAAIRDYYDNQYRSGRCPPGLAKKHNGCMPPGQAKKWVMGRPLPRDVIFYDLPPAVVSAIGAPPPGYRFVRVASDILMISIGTGMVIDAINDLGRY